MIIASMNKTTSEMLLPRARKHKEGEPDGPRFYLLGTSQQMVLAILNHNIENENNLKLKTKHSNYKVLIYTHKNHYP